MEIQPSSIQPSLKSYKEEYQWPENSGSDRASNYYRVPMVNFQGLFHSMGENNYIGRFRFGTPRQDIDVQVRDTIDLKLLLIQHSVNNVIVINKDLVIVNSLAGQTPIHCVVSGAAIVINSGRTVHLHDLSFTGMCTNIIQNQGNLHLHHVKFDATGVSGNVLRNIGGEARVYEVVELKQ